MSTEVNDRKEVYFDEYRDLLAKHGPEDFRSMDFGDAEGTSSRRRYKVMAKYCNFADKNVIELGCGFGSFCKFKFPYKTFLGCDYLKEYIDIANAAQYPNATFVTSSVEDFDLTKYQKGDVVIMSGVASNREGPCWHPALLDTLIERVFTSSPMFIVNFASIYATIRNNLVTYEDPGQVLHTFMRHTRCVVMDHSYMWSDFTIVAAKPNWGGEWGKKA